MTDAIDQDACALIRELLCKNGVPTAGFIDDHVANAIVQRNILATCLAEVAEALPKDAKDQARAALAKAYPTGVDLTRLGDAVARHFQKEGRL